MGLIYASSDSAQLMSALKKNLQSGKEASNQLKTGSQKVITAVDGQTLSGAAYTAGKGLFSELILPTISKVTSAIDSIEQELQTYTNADQNISSEGTLDEDKLNQQIATKKAMKASVDASAEVARALSRNNPVAKILDALLDVQNNLKRMSNTFEDDIRELEKKLEKLRQFSSQTNGLFANSLNDMKLAMQGVLVLNNTIVNSDGSYSLPAGIDKSWFKNLKDTKQLRKMEEKKAYIQLLQDQFGFDEATAQQIFKMKEGIDEKFPKLSQKEKDYLLARILGEFSYSEGLANKMLWPNTAGDLSDYFYTEVLAGSEGKIKIPKELKEILLYLGLSEKEYKELHYNLRLQHEMSPGNLKAEELPPEAYRDAKNTFMDAYGQTSDEEFNKFWNQKLIDFDGKGDFTHQSITTATILDEKIRPANATGLYTGRFDSESVDEIAGWKGDTTTQALKPPSIGNDDYKADLDAVNITQRMKEQSISYSQASNEYYSALSNQQTNRAEEFKKNVNYDYVKKEILKDLTPQTKPTGISGMNPDNPPSVATTEEEQLRYLKEKYPASYDFIESLKNNENEYTNYHK
ncbi:hypothetical protein ABZ133_001854 [Listeria monocytogenes]|nr:hypothetical protein [Listeria monocytogenes]EKZ3558225.1 hypothetical protein [Listeria monocytogenes]ELO1552434.1 hypothetical protein [Listeria monocytogenes]